MSTGKSYFRNGCLIEQWTSGYARPYRLRSKSMRERLFVDIYNNRICQPEKVMFTETKPSSVEYK